MPLEEAFAIRVPEIRRRKNSSQYTAEQSAKYSKPAYAQTIREHCPVSCWVGGRKHQHLGTRKKHLKYHNTAADKKEILVH